jgi:hypothetical protein
MMEPLNIWDNDGHAYTPLARVLNVLPLRSRTTEWQLAEYVEQDGSPEFWVIEPEDQDTINQAFETTRRLLHGELIDAANEVIQVIWASFRGYDSQSGNDPWIVLSGVDSTFWEVLTDDLETRRLVSVNFKDVRKGKM